MIIEVKDISFIQYSELENKTKYNYYLKYAKLESNDLFKLGSFEDLPFGFVKDIQEHLNYTGLSWQVFIEEISKQTKIQIKELALMSIFELHKVRLYLLDEIKTINKLESNNLSHNPTIEEQQAGLEVFEKYRSFLQFDKLTGGDITKIDKIREIPYSVCFAKLMLDADKYEFDYKLNRLRK